MQLGKREINSRSFKEWVYSDVQIMREMESELISTFHIASHRTSPVLLVLLGVFAVIMSAKT